MFNLLYKMSKIRFSKASVIEGAAAALLVTGVRIWRKRNGTLEESNAAFLGKTALHAGLAFVGVGLSSEGLKKVFQRTPSEFVWAVMLSEPMVSATINNVLNAPEQPTDKLQQNPNLPQFVVEPK